MFALKICLYFVQGEVGGARQHGGLPVHGAARQAGLDPGLGGGGAAPRDLQGLADRGGGAEPDKLIVTLRPEVSWMN